MTTDLSRHQRAKRLAMWNFALSTGATGGSVIGGYISLGLGWRWNFGICAIANGILAILFFFLVPETVFIRDSKLETDRTGDDLAAAIQASKEEKIHAEEVQLEQALSNALPPRKKTYLETLKPWTGQVYDHDNFFKIAFRPLVCYMYPIILWATLCYGASVTWLGCYGFVLAQVYSAQYGFNAGQVGLVGLSPWIFGMIGNIMGGPFVDWAAKMLARRNKGIYEPEFRLPLLIASVVIGSIGYFGFGQSIEAGDHCML